MQQNERISWFDNLRVIASFAVITIHASLPLLDKFDLTDSMTMKRWWTGNFFDSFSRFSVPVFLMMSGALLLGRDTSISDFYKKRLSRIVIPFLLWSIIYLIWDNNWSTAHSFAEAVSFSWDRLRRGTSYHLWYVYMLIGQYLFLPFINKWIRNSTEKEIQIFLCFWLLTCLLRWPSFELLSTYIDLIHFTGYFGFLVLGYYLSVKQFSTRNLAAIALFIVIAVTCIIILGTYYDTKKTGATSSVYYDYLSLTVIAQATGAFLFLRAIMTGSKKLPGAFINTASHYSYGIYLAHVLALNYLQPLFIRKMLIDPGIWLPLEVASCFFISFAVIWAIHKIPVIGKYISG